MPIVGRDLRCSSRSWLYLRVHRLAKVLTRPLPEAAAAVEHGPAPDGTFRWTTPSGRDYITEPTRYPI
jgi:hypothetical protein